MLQLTNYMQKQYCHKYIIWCKYYANMSTRKHPFSSMKNFDVKQKTVNYSNDYRTEKSFYKSHIQAKNISHWSSVIKVKIKSRE